MDQDWSLFKHEQTVVSTLDLSQESARREVVLVWSTVHMSLKTWGKKGTSSAFLLLEQASLSTD